MAIIEYMFRYTVLMTVSKQINIALFALDQKPRNNFGNKSHKESILPCKGNLGPSAASVAALTIDSTS
jgi:hypothetical protein